MAKKTAKKKGAARVGIDPISTHPQQNADRRDGEVANLVDTQQAKIDYWLSLRRNPDAATPQEQDGFTPESYAYYLQGNDAFEDYIDSLGPSNLDRGPNTTLRQAEMNGDPLRQAEVGGEVFMDRPAFFASRGHGPGSVSETDSEGNAAIEKEFVAYQWEFYGPADDIGAGLGKDAEVAYLQGPEVFDAYLTMMLMHSNIERQPNTTLRQASVNGDPLPPALNPDPLPPALNPDPMPTWRETQAELRKGQAEAVHVVETVGIVGVLGTVAFTGLVVWGTVKLFGGKR